MTVIAPAYRSAVRRAAGCSRATRSHSGTIASRMIT